MPDRTVDRAVCRATAAEEQDWIAAVLREPVAKPAVRVWLYDRPAVVLGRSRPLTADLAERAADARADLSLRPSGGGAVLAGPWLLGASVILPPGGRLVTASIPQSFRWLGLAHVAWLAGIGIAARAVPESVGPRDDPLRWSCFASLSHWEVEVGERKIVGLAQARRRNGILFSSGALIASPPWQVLCDVLGQPSQHGRALAERTVSCAELLGRVPEVEHAANSLLQELSTVVTAQEPG